MRNVIIMGAGGRDFHDFNVVYRNDADVEVVAFTGTDWPDFGNIRYPTSLAGSRYPNGIAVFPEEQLADLIVDHSVDEVVLAYAGLSHDDVMHRASVVLAAGANFTLLGPDTTMLRATTPVVAVCAARTGSGKSQASRRIGQILLDAGLRVALISHPLSYHGLEERPVQRFATGADIASSDLTIEEREAYERPVEMGMVVFAGVDYRAVITQAQAEADASCGTAVATTSRSFGRTFTSWSSTRRVLVKSSATTQAKRTCGWPTSFWSTRWTQRTPHASSAPSRR